MSVLIVERGEPGREASWAAGGMLVDSAMETPPALQPLASASARMYPEFVHELEDESGLKIDLRAGGTPRLQDDRSAADPPRQGASSASSGQALATAGEAPALRLPAPLAELEPDLRAPAYSSVFLPERSVDPRDVTSAAIAAVRHRGVDFSSGDHVLAVEVSGGKAMVVRTNKTSFAAGVVINCAGAWAGQVGPHTFPARPVKGQMLCVIMPDKNLLRHVVRAPDMYLIPRSDGRLLIGATVEEAGFDKKTVPATILKLRQSALELVPRLADARILEAWAGLRPGTPDALPILGATATPGYFVATGHFRDGILLAPITAKLLAELVTGATPAFDLKLFSPARFPS